MSDTVELQILKAMYQRLKACPDLEGVTWSDRSFSVARERLPAIDVDLLEARPARAAKPVHLYEVGVAVTVQEADSPTGDYSAAEKADPLVAAVHRVLMADRTLGGVCAEINPMGRRWRRNEIDGASVAVECLFQIQYACSAQDITVIAR